MDQLTVLLAKLIIHESNMRCLHWLVKGSEFDNSHSGFTTSYYEMISNDIDYVAECLMRNDKDVLNYEEALEIAREENSSMIDSDKKYASVEAAQICNQIFSSILLSLEAVLESTDIKDNIKNVGIRSSLESMYERYDKEKRFLNKRRLL